MKLYQFTYIDNEKLSESTLLSRVSAFLENEALFQSWAPDYTFKQCQAPVSLSDDSLQYFYEVDEKFFDSENLEEDDKPKLRSKSNSGVAAKEVEL